MLSGGVDSSTVVGLARGLSSKALRTYSAVSADDEDCRESRNVRAVIGQGGVEARLLGTQDLPEWAPTLGQATDRVEDPFDYHNLLLAFMYTAARADGSARGR